MRTWYVVTEKPERPVWSLPSLRTKTVDLGFGHKCTDYGSMSFHARHARVDVPSMYVCVSVVDARISALGRGASLSFAVNMPCFSAAVVAVGRRALRNVCGEVDGIVYDDAG